MIEEILKTLSDAELVAISKQLGDNKIDENIIWAQLVFKANEGQTLCDVINKAKYVASIRVEDDSFRGTLPRLVALELSKRLLKANEMRNFSLLNPEE